MSLQFLHSHDAEEKHADAIWGIHWTPYDRVLSVSADGTLRQYDSSSPDQTTLVSSYPSPPHPVGIVSLSVNERGTKALYNSLEGRTVLIDLESGELVQVGVYESFVRSGAGGENEPAWSISLHPTEETYAATGGSGNVIIHSAAQSNFGERLSKLESGRSKMGMCCKYSPDGTRLALSLETGQIYIFDLASSSLLSTYTAHAMTVRALAWSPDSTLLLSASDDRRLTLFDVREKGKGGGGGAVASLVGHGSWVLSTAFSPDGRLVLSGSADKTIKVWDIGTRAAVTTLQDNGEVWAVSWRPHISPGSAGAFVSGGEDGVVRWWRSAGAS